MLSDFLSQKFKFWTFASMFVLVFVHGYNLEIRYLQPWTIPEEPLTITSYIEYFLANGIFRFRIPLLFIISGYLFALHDATPHWIRIRKRLRTLLVPYLLWSAVAIALTFLLEDFSFTRDMVAGSQVVQIDQTRVLVHQYHWYEVVARWIFFPISYQLWFIRVLLIYNLAYPWILWCLGTTLKRRIFFGIVILFWISTGGFVLIEGEGLLFFSLGIWIQKSEFNIGTNQNSLKPKFWAIVFIVLTSLKTWLAFQGMALLGPAVGPVLLILHKIVVFSGLIACWYLSDGAVRFLMGKKWFLKLSTFSFIIYALHAPLIAFCITPALELLSDFTAYRMLTFLLLPLAIILLCIAVGMILRNVAPRFYNLLTGGRTW